MRRFALYLFVGLLYTANAFAADSSISRTIPTKSAVDATEQKSETGARSRSARVDEHSNTNTVSRSVSRTVPIATKPSANVISRSVNNRKTGNRATLSDGVNTVGRSARTEAASINNTAAVRRAGITLRASTAEVGGRATIGNTDVQTGSNIDEQVRNVQSRASIFGNKKQKVTAESLAEAKDLLEKTADLNNTCQQQYNECMDQFCAVVDANQKRMFLFREFGKVCKITKGSRRCQYRIK